MQRVNRPEAVDLSSLRAHRAPSVSSDIASHTGSLNGASSVAATPAPCPRPLPAYVAVAAASQMVTDHHRAVVRDRLAPDAAEDGRSSSQAGVALPGDDADALFSEDALALVNSFLDYLLYNVLAQGRSPSLTSIRPAVVDVLKSKLAREAIAAADEELEGLLAGEDEDDLDDMQDEDGASSWDLDAVWKRTRLRIMVYIRLGEMEDDDEDRYLAQEELLNRDRDIDPPGDTEGLVSWTAAIFLTSVLEYVAEQTLLIAGQAAYLRFSRRGPKTSETPTMPPPELIDRIVVEEHDVEKVALSSILGRLWRTWRKRLRTPVGGVTSPASVRRNGSYMNYSHVRRASTRSMDSQEEVRHLSYTEIPEREPTEAEIAANIPLPMTENDVDEIEGVILLSDLEDDDLETPRARERGRPSSVIYRKPKSLLGEAIELFTRAKRPMSMPVVPPVYTAPEPASSPARSVSSSAGFVTPNEDGETEKDRSSFDLGDGNAEDGEAMAANGRSTKALPTLATAVPRRQYISPEAEEEGASPVSPMREDEIATAERYTGRVSMIDGPPRQLARGSDRDPGMQSIRENDAVATGHPDSLERDHSLEEDRGAHGDYDDRRGTYEHDESQYDEDEMGEHRGIGVAKTMDVPVPSPQIRSTAIANEEELRAHEQRTMSRKPVPQNSERSPASEVEEDFVPAAFAKTSQGKQYTGTTVTNIRVNGTPQKPLTPERSEGLEPAADARRSESRSTPRKSTDTANNYTRKAVPNVDQNQRPPSAHSRKPASVGRVTLHSSKSSGSNFGRISSDSPQDFDMLIRGDRTVKYTLTSQNMRDIEATDPVSLRAPPEIPREPSPASYARGMAALEQTARTHNAGLRRSPPTDASGERTLLPSRAPPGQQQRRQQQQEQEEETGRNGLAAREPRIQTESLRDMADFIRSTGPTGRQANKMIAGNRGGAQTKRAATAAAPASPTSPASTGSGGRDPVGRTSSMRRRLHLEPRSAAGTSAGNTELIDFLREGPPSAGASTSVRGAAAPSLNNRPSNSAMNNAPSSKASTSTVNSRTGLLASSAPAPTNGVTQPSNNATGTNGAEDMPIPTKTRRRVKDPYAIDSDNDDEDLLTALPTGSSSNGTHTPAARRQEANLIEFLNEAEPPAPAVQPVKPTSPRSKLSKPAPVDMTHPYHGNNALNGNGQAGANTSRTNSSALASHPPSSSPPSAATVKPASGGGRGGAARKMQAKAGMAARTGGGENNSTRELADFLRNSGPPEPARRGSGAGTSDSQSATASKKGRWGRVKALAARE